MSVHIFGSFPSPLYRAFTEEEHALDFLERGCFIMRPLSYYTEIEDLARKDKDEGVGRLKIMRPRPVVNFDRRSISCEIGDVTHGIISCNPTYVLCCSGPEVDLNYLLEKGFRYVVRIDQPNTLLSEIGSHLERCPGMPDTMWLHCIQVRYDKGQLVEAIPEPGTEERFVMSFSQKAPEFRGECEHRICLRLPLFPGAPEEVRIELRKKIDYACMVASPRVNR